ncbi:hypothetical protein BOX15_Mlig012231g3 [Macrostomum lignano]|uniref:Uncharacterized protein n=1 Tax=Macrostomum lignano TaxID=282301 RepID=A0A267G5Z3_9PLAT|nr:hypothetical protein BOX15_Mlig012231g3 [Macrostomum lignano]
MRVFTNLATFAQLLLAASSLLLSEVWLDILYIPGHHFAAKCQPASAISPNPCTVLVNQRLLCRCSDFQLPVSLLHLLASFGTTAAAPPQLCPDIKTAQLSPGSHQVQSAPP